MSKINHQWIFDLYTYFVFLGLYKSIWALRQTIIGWWVVTGHCKVTKFQKKTWQFGERKAINRKLGWLRKQNYLSAVCLAQQYRKITRGTGRVDVAAAFTVRSIKISSHQPNLSQQKAGLLELKREQLEDSCHRLFIIDAVTLVTHANSHPGHNSFFKICLPPQL